MSDLERNIVNLVLSRKTISLRIKYIFMAIVFYPFVYLEEKNNKVKGKDDGNPSAAGDDVYPLF